MHPEKEHRGEGLIKAVVVPFDFDWIRWFGLTGFVILPLAFILIIILTAYAILPEPSPVAFGVFMIAWWGTYFWIENREGKWR